jgi:hypothetical protein
MRASVCALSAGQLPGPSGGRFHAGAFVALVGTEWAFVVDLGCQNMSKKPNSSKLLKLSDRDSFIESKKANVTASSPVNINIDACQRLALLLKSKSIPIDKEDTDLQGFSGEQVGNFYLFLVAICHQTPPRGKPALEGTVNGVYKRG